MKNTITVMKNREVGFAWMVNASKTKKLDLVCFADSNLENVNEVISENLMVTTMHSLKESFEDGTDTKLVKNLNLRFVNKGVVTNEADFIENLISEQTTAKGLIVVGADDNTAKEVKARESKFNGVDILFISKLVRDELAKGKFIKDKRIFSSKNNFVYNRADVMKKNIITVTGAEVTVFEETTKLTAYEELAKLISASGKQTILQPVYKQSVYKKGKITIHEKYATMEPRSESALSRYIGWDTRKVKLSKTERSIVNSIVMDIEQDLNVTYDMMHVELIDEPRNSKDMVHMGAHAETKKMLKNCAYIVPTKHTTTNATGYSVIDRSESFELFLTKKEAVAFSNKFSDGTVIKMEVAMASQSQTQSNKATFVNAELKVSDRFIEGVEFRLSNGDTIWGKDCGVDYLYPEYLKSLRGRASALEMATSLAFGVNLSNEFINWVEKNYSEIDLTLAKSIANYNSKIEGSGVVANIRAAQATTNSNGYIPEKAFEVNHMGSVKYILPESLLKELSELYNLSEAKMKAAWKAEKLDGQSIIKRSMLVAALKALGLRKEARAVQSRLVSQKGMLLAIDDDLYESLGFMGDVTVEGNSYKYEVNQLAKDNFELSLVNTEKSDENCSLNYQYLLSLCLYKEDSDGNPYNDVSTLNSKVIPEIVNSFFDEIKEALSGDLPLLLKYVGLYNTKKDVVLNNILDLDGGSLSTKTALVTYLAGEKAVDDGWIKAKIYEIARNSMEKLLNGGIPVEGATKYVISDPTAMLRTDLMARKHDTDNSILIDAYGNTLATLNNKGKYISVECTLGTEVEVGDIIISKQEQVALRGFHDAYWGNTPRYGKALAMRTPNSHEGEPQVINLVDLRKDVPQFIDVMDKNGNMIQIDCWNILSMTPNIVILGGFNVILEALGGADTDGDRIHIILDERIIALRPDFKYIPPTIVEAGNSKKATMKMGFDMIPDNVLKSLISDGTGILTNTNTKLIEMKRVLEFFKSLYINGIAAGNTPERMAQRVSNNILKPDGFMEEIKAIKEAADKALCDDNLFYDLLDGKVDFESPLVEEKNIAIEWSNIKLDTTMDNINDLIGLLNRSSIMIKRLQEKAISSAKTGIYVRLEALKFLSGEGRVPYWFNGTKKKARYETFIIGKNDKHVSLTPMDAVFHIVKSKFASIDEIVYKEVPEKDYDSYDDSINGYDPEEFDQHMWGQTGFYDENAGYNNDLSSYVAFDLETYKKKRLAPQTGKIKIPVINLDQKKFIEASAMAAKVGAKYLEDMQIAGALEAEDRDRAKVVRQRAFDKHRGYVLSMEKRFGFNETMAALYNTASEDSEGNKLKAVSPSYTWVVCADMMFKFLKAAFEERHMLMNKSEAISKGYNYEPAFDDYVAVCIDEATDAMEQAGVTSELALFINNIYKFSTTDIVKKYDKSKSGAKSALTAIFGSVNKDMTLSIKTTTEGFVELFYGTTPVLSGNCLGAQATATLAVLNGRKVKFKLSYNQETNTLNQAGNFEYNGVSVNLVVTEIL